MRFLLIEDNDELARATAQRLSLDGHAVDRVGDLDGARACVAAARFDLILLDIMLPDGDGRGFLAEARDSGAGTPVIVITARSEVSDRVRLLDLGADDYIVKPFDFAELAARMRAVLRRRGGPADSAVTLSDVTLDTLAGVLRLEGGEEALRNRELRLCEIFFAQPGRIFSKAHLVDRLFGFSEEASENAIEVYVGRLRRKLAGSALSIETVRGLGYRLVVEG